MRRSRLADPANGVNRDAAGADPARPHSFEKLVPGYGLNRDPERTPMRWDGGPHGGFTTGEPHLPMGDDVQVRNVMALKEDQRSLLWLYRRLMALRRATPALTAGDYRPLRSHNDILRFERGLR